VAQVDRNLHQMAHRLRAVFSQRRRLELQHPRLVEFVDGDAVRPGQAPRPRVQARRQDDNLAHAGADGVEEERVEEGRPRGHVVHHALHAWLQVGRGVGDLRG
jgi:hypothetical protein